MLPNDVLTAIVLTLILSFIHVSAAVSAPAPPFAKYVILMIADGWGMKHIEATNDFTSTTPLFQTDPMWTKYYMSTYPYLGGYAPSSFWGDFNYALTSNPTDSAAAATVLYTGDKTQLGNICVDHNGVRSYAIGEKAKVFNRAVGAVSTVPASHATPGAWVAHNDDRNNAYAIADEGFFGDPNTTGINTDLYYAGGKGPTNPTADVIIGDGASGYINSAIRSQLNTDHPNTRYFVDCQTDGSISDCGQALQDASVLSGVTKMAGLFNRADLYATISSPDPFPPTLAEMAKVALTVLNKNQNGFVLMVEGGAVDWAGHANNMDNMIGEMIDFNNAVDEVINWVNTTTGVDWSNTLLIVTGDHECGYLTADFGVLPDAPLGEVSAATLSLERIEFTQGRRASWEDNDNDSVIDAGETVYWAWNTGGHSNSLVPLYCRGVGCDLFPNYYEITPDPVRGNYFDNQHVWTVMDTVFVVVIPTLTLPTVTSINTDNAILGATIDYDGGASVTERGTVWGTAPLPTSNQLAEGGTGTGGFSHTRSSLPEGSQLYYRGYAVNSAGIGYSSNDFFYTEPIQVSFISFTNIAHDAMQINWINNSVYSSNALVLMKQGAPVDSAPADGTQYAANSNFQSGQELGTGNYVVFAGPTGSGRQVDVSGLSPGATYYVAVYAYAGSGTLINYQQDAPATANQTTVSDTDGDGILDDGDSSGTAGDAPCAGGNTSNCDDNCNNAPNPAQDDSDNDGVGDLCDVCTDVDGDTYAIEGGGCGQVDCNDNSPAINPAATEVCNDLVDNDCDGLADMVDPDCAAVSYYCDSDLDTYHSAAVSGTCAYTGCEPIGCLTAAGNDCNDSNPGINPGAAEVANDGIDQDCNGADTIMCIVDADQDGYGTYLGTTILAADGSCDTAQSESATSDDCNDGDGGINPGAADIANDGVDQDCDGTDNTTCFTISAISGNTTETGGTSTFTVKLNCIPDGDVVISLVSSDTTEGTVSQTGLVYTVTNWNTNQTVTVTGVDDEIADGNQGYSVELTINVGRTDDTTGYADLDPPDVPVINEDNEFFSVGSGSSGGGCSITEFKSSKSGLDLGMLLVVLAPFWMGLARLMRSYRS